MVINMPRANKTADAYLDDLYKIFAQRYQTNQKAWGQFLDSPGEHTQVGRYGTSAGAIVMALSNHQNDPKAEDVSDRLKGWLTEEEQENIKHLIQTLPFVTLIMALSMLGKNVDAHLEELLNRRLASTGLWGNYWVDAQLHDEETSIFVSSIVLIVLTFVELNQEQRSILERCRRRLEELYFRDRQKHRAYDPVVFAALVKTVKDGISKRLAKEMRRYSHKQISLAERYTYFYDFRGPDDSWGREYFIVPVEIFCAMLVGNNAAPDLYRLRAVDVINQLMENLDSNAGVFRPISTDRQSTLEQAFVALALDSYRESVDYRWFNVSSIHFSLLKPRPHLDIVGQWLLIVLYLELVVLLSPMFSGVPMSPWQDWLIKASLFVAGAMKNPVDVIRHVLGRAD